MSALRYLLILAVIAAPIYISAQCVPHTKEESPFIILYMHLVPEKLVTPESVNAEQPSGVPAAAPAYVFEFTVPSAPAIFDMDEHVEGTQLVMTNLQLFQIAAVLLVVLCFAPVPNYLRTGRGDKFTRILAGFASWARDEMVCETMGKDLGAKFAPYFLSLFFFVLFMNLFGLVPGGATATASVFVTGALAIVTLLTMLIGGMIAQGPVSFWKHLVPPVPILLWPLMLVIELAGLVIKPVALMIRLFANMLGGHMVVLSFMGLIFFFGMQKPAVGWATAPVAVAFAVFIMIIEAFVAFLQAYIFTKLSILFVSASIHPEH